jgi:hypothetical protein
MTFWNLYSSLAIAQSVLYYPLKPSSFEVIALNSPVKEPYAKFRVKLPSNFQIETINVKLVNTRNLLKDKGQFEETPFANNELKLSVAKLPPGFYRLYVKIKDKKSKREESFQTNFHDFVRFVIDESREVPMPDPKVNNSTLGGMDSDNNGIRDDVQRFINENYGSNENIKLAAKQLAQDFQSKLLVSDKEEAIFFLDKQAEAIWCLGGIAGDSLAYIKTLEPLYLNTEERIRKSLLVRSWYHGQGLPKSIDDYQESGIHDRSVLCSFKPNAHYVKP